MSCSRKPSATLLAAIRQFNDGAYFVCHETLEELWNERHDPLRDLYKGMLQIAVGLLHLEKGNDKGARALLTRGVDLVSPFRPNCLAIDLEGLIDQAETVLGWLDDPDTQPQSLLAERRPQIRLLAHRGNT